MKTVKVSEATNLQLDWLVAKCEGLLDERGCLLDSYCDSLSRDAGGFCDDPSQGLPILDRELIDTYYDIHWVREALDPEDNGERWYASPAGNDELGFYGATRLVAGLRVFVALKLGETVEVPEELA